MTSAKRSREEEDGLNAFETHGLDADASISVSTSTSCGFESANSHLRRAKRPRLASSSSSSASSHAGTTTDRLTSLPSELLLRILHQLPLTTILTTGLLNHKWQHLANDPQVWKRLYYERFVRPRALRIPGLKDGKEAGDNKDGGKGLFSYSSRRSRWLDEERLLGGEEWKWKWRVEDNIGDNPSGSVDTVKGKAGNKERERTDWKARYRLRHNWSIGAAEVREIGLSPPSHPADTSTESSSDEDEGREEEDDEEIAAIEENLIVRLVDGVVITADAKDGLRAWDVKSAKHPNAGKACLAHLPLTSDVGGLTLIPTSLGIDTAGGREGVGMGIAVGFRNGVFGIWRLVVGTDGEDAGAQGQGRFVEVYKRVCTQRKGGMEKRKRLSAVAYSHPYLLTINAEQLLSLYTFDSPRPPLSTSSNPADNINGTAETTPSIEPMDIESLKPFSSGLPNHPTLLTSLKSHTSWPPLTLSLRSTPLSLIASIAYSFPTYTSGFSVGLQELHLDALTGEIVMSRLSSSVESGFHSLLSSPNSSSTSRTGSPSRGGVDDMRGQFIRGGNRRQILTRPTSLSYTHPYLLSSHSDNTLSLYLVSSTPLALSISKPTKLWGHTSAVSGAEIGGRGKAVSFAAAADVGGISSASFGGRTGCIPGEVRVWELEGGARGRGKSWKGEEDSVKVWGKESSTVDDAVDINDENDDKRARGEAESVSTERMGNGWVGFDDDVVVVVQGSVGSSSATGNGRMRGQRLVVYDFT